MIVRVLEDKHSLSEAAAEQASGALRRAMFDHGCARIIVATGTSQLDFLDALTNAKNIDWRGVEMFHLDEYIGLPITHPASFRKYLLERLIQRVGITRYYFLDGDGDPAEVVRRVGEALRSAPVDVAFVGIGENGHLAFNDPPADFQTDESYLVVTLFHVCAPNPQVERNHCRRSGCAQSPSGKALLRRGNQSDGPSFNFAYPSRRNALSG